MITAKRYTPKAIVSFSTEQGDIVLRAETSSQGSAIDKEILSISTNNDLEADAGTFQITLANRRRWDEVLASNDFVRIQMSREGNEDSKQATVMMGLIDDVRRSTSVEGGTPQRSIVVTGRTFAKALINFEVGVVQEVTVTESSLGWIAGRISFAGESAAGIVQQIFEVLVHEYMNYEFKNGESFKSYTRLNLTSRPGERLFDDKSFVNYQGSMQSFLREVINEPFNQMFWECYDGYANYVVRETPFNPETWNALPTHIVYDEDVMNDSTGRSDVESYSLFSVGMQNFFSSFDVNQTLMVYPFWYEPHFKKHGLRRLHRFTGYIGYAGDGGMEDSREELIRYQEDLYNWNILNPSFYNGFLTVRGDNKFKVGDRLLYLSVEDGRELEFFIESVNHEFVNFGSWVTRLGVTRGLPNGGERRFEAPWGKYETYEGGALGEPVIPPTPTGTGSDSDFVMPGGIPTGNIANVLSYAQSFLNRNTTYVWGGGRTQSDIDRGRFDCSSYVHHVFKQNGITLHSPNPANVTTQQLINVGSPVNGLQNMRPGDLVFFNTNRKNGHVGIYLGDGKWIGAQSSTGVAIATLDSPYWKSRISTTIRRP